MDTNLLTQSVAHLESELEKLKTTQTDSGWAVRSHLLNCMNPATDSYMVDEWRYDSLGCFSVLIVPSYVGQKAWSPLDISCEFLLGANTTWEVLLREHSSWLPVYALYHVGAGYVLHFQWFPPSQGDNPGRGDFHFRINVLPQSIQAGAFEVFTNPDWDSAYDYWEWA